MKKFFKGIVASILGWQVRRLRKRHHFKLVAVAGSVGKTSTKLAIAQVLSQRFATRYQSGNYNDIVSVPLIFFGHKMPRLFNPFAWLAIFFKNEKIIWGSYPYEAVVVELGSDKPGDVPAFSRYIRADIGVLTGITPEHMEFFADLDAVAKEETAIADYSNELLVNADLCPPEYLKHVKDGYNTYGAKKPAHYRLRNIKFSKDFADFEVTRKSDLPLSAKHESVSEPQLLSICAAVAVGDQLGMEPDEIKLGIDSIKPVSGRMRRLSGANGSTIIDDSYNASPEAMKAALDTLYRLSAGKKIAVLGNMNELGGYSQKLHEEIGRYCDPRELELVVTIGPDANRFLAPMAESKGCKIETFEDPYSAGEFVKQRLNGQAAVLVKGSQNGVFAEEVVKILLADPADARKLVRQTPKWLKTKQKAFKK